MLDIIQPKNEVKNEKKAMCKVAAPEDQHSPDEKSLIYCLFSGHMVERMANRII